MMGKEMTGHYDRSGRSITMVEWLGLLKDKRVALDEDVAGKYSVSTVWTGLDFFDRPPRIFETMVFTEEEDPIDRMGSMVTEP